MTQPDAEHATDSLNEHSKIDDTIAYLVARRANRPQLPSVINVPDGAYLSVALLAVASLVVAAWWPNTMPFWIAALPGMLLLAGFTMKGVFGGLLLYEGWLRWRKQRKEDEGCFGGGLL